jgi:protein TonB
MTDSSPPDVLHGSHNPFDDPRPKKKSGLLIALLIAFVVHVALFTYLWKSKFEPQFKEYSDDVTDVSIVKPVPPPPPPPPPPAATGAVPATQRPVRTRPLTAEPQEDEVRD